MTEEFWKSEDRVLDAALANVEEFEDHLFTHESCRCEDCESTKNDKAKAFA
jgi:hypothetical protein